MREHIRQMIDQAQRSADSPTCETNRIGVDKQPHDRSTLLAAEAIRLARLATSIHLSRAAEVIARSNGAAAHSRDRSDAAASISSEHHVVRELLP